MTSAYEKVINARSQNRLKASDYLDFLFDDFIELHGDRNFKDDPSIIAGIASFNKKPVTVIAQAKATNLEENLRRNFAMTSPSGYRKAIRLAKEAEKFQRPVIFLIDTPGAYPGIEAENNGQANAIAQCLKVFSDLNTITIALVISEGGSGGALAFSVVDCLLMNENAVYSILSPEGFASILFKDESKASQAAELMELTAIDLLEKKVIDEIISEKHNPLKNAYLAIDSNLQRLEKIKMKNLLNKRYQKFRKLGNVYD